MKGIIKFKKVVFDGSSPFSYKTISDSSIMKLLHEITTCYGIKIHSYQCCNGEGEIVLIDNDKAKLKRAMINFVENSGTTLTDVKFKLKLF